MSQETPSQNVPIKQEHQPQQQQPVDHPIHKHNSYIHPQQNIMYQTSSLLKNHFQSQYRYNWMDTSPIPPPFNPFYGYHPCYQNCNFNMSPFAGPPSKSFQEKQGMTRTTDPFNPTPFMSGTNYHPFHHMPFPQQNHFNSVFQSNKGWVVSNQQMQSSNDAAMIKIQDDSERQRGLRQKKLKLKMKNETKNIPKNYGKAMISFILSHLDWIQSQFGIERRQQLVSQLKKRKNSINAIVHLKELWTTSKYAKQFRILSNLFIRKYSYAYIFNSRVSNYSTHIKYKYKLQQALKSPGNFSRIKQY